MTIFCPYMNGRDKEERIKKIINGGCMVENQNEVLHSETISLVSIKNYKIHTNKIVSRNFTEEAIERIIDCLSILRTEDKLENFILDRTGNLIRMKVSKNGKGVSLYECSKFEIDAKVRIDKILDDCIGKIITFAECYTKPQDWKEHEALIICKRMKYDSTTNGIVTFKEIKNDILSDLAPKNCEEIITIIKSKEFVKRFIVAINNSLQETLKVLVQESKLKECKELFNKLACDPYFDDKYLKVKRIIG